MGWGRYVFHDMTCLYVWLNLILTLSGKLGPLVLVLVLVLVVVLFYS